MSVSLLLTYIPEKRGEVHSEHKLSTLSLSSRNKIFPRWPEPAWLPFRSQLCGNRGAARAEPPKHTLPQAVGRIRPQHAWGMGGQPGVRGQSRCYTSQKREAPGTSGAGGSSVEGGLLPAPGCLCLEITWYLVAPSHSTNVDVSTAKRTLQNALKLPPFSVPRCWK